MAPTALERLLERGITRQEVIQTLLFGEVIERYPEDRPLPSCLLLYCNDQPLHVVAAVDEAVELVYVVTAYRPDHDHFGPDFRTRRKRNG